MKKILIPSLLTLIIVSGCSAIPPDKSDNTVPKNIAGKIHGHADTTKGEIAPAALYEKILKKENFVLLDVREASEYEEAHIPATTHRISVNDLSDATLQQAGIKKDDQIVVYCRSGNRSRTAAKLLRELGYSNVLELNSGIIHWIEDGLPVESGTQTINTNTAFHEANQPAVAFDRTTHDFGEIPQFGGLVQTTFKIRNNGTVPLEIATITTSCSCTEAKLEETTIQPGAETILTVTFNPNLHEEPLEKFKRTIFIPSNDPRNPEAELTIEVDILEGK